MRRVDIDGPAAALEFYRERKQADPDAFVFREEGVEALVLLYMLVGRPTAALEAAELYVEEFPDSWRGYAHLAEALHLDGEVGFAIETYEQALALAPANTRLRKALEALRAEAASSDSKR